MQDIKLEAWPTVMIAILVVFFGRVSEVSFIFTVFIIGVAVALCTWMNELLMDVNFRLPAYVTALISDLSLSLFLSISLMSLQLWKYLKNERLRLYIRAKFNFFFT